MQGKRSSSIEALRASLCIIMGCKLESCGAGFTGLWRTPYLSKNAWLTLDITSSSGLPNPSRHLTSPDIVLRLFIHCPKRVLQPRLVLPRCAAYDFAPATKLAHAARHLFRLLSAANDNCES